jgi:hypothetical protein
MNYTINTIKEQCTWTVHYLFKHIFDDDLPENPTPMTILSNFGCRAKVQSSSGDTWGVRNDKELLEKKLLWCPKSSIGFTKHYRAADGGQPAVIRVRK